MLLTNKHKLPQQYVNLVTRWNVKQKRADYSVTHLITPPQLAVLRERHDAEITEDVSDLVWRVFGQIAHKLYEEKNAFDRFNEEPMILDIGGVTVSATPDSYSLEADGTLDDYKVTSVFSILLGLKTEWETQLNCYKLFFERNGFQVSKMRILGMLRDWQKAKAAVDPAYPPTAFPVIDVPLWADGEAMWYMEERIVNHSAAAELSDADLATMYPCSGLDKWERAPTHCAMKVGNKRSSYGSQTTPRTEVAVNDWIARQKNPRKFSVAFRPGARVRCAGYCVAAPFCRQKAAEDAAEGTMEADE